MAKTERTISPRGTAELLFVAAAIGLIVWMVTSDLVLGVIAGAGFSAVVGLVARTWVGHSGHHLTHP